MTSFLQIFPLQHCKHFLFLSSIPCSSHLSLDFIILIILCNNKSWYFTLRNFLQCMLTVVRTKMSILLSLDWVGKKIHILRQNITGSELRQQAQHYFMFQVWTVIFPICYLSRFSHPLHLYFQTMSSSILLAALSLLGPSIPPHHPVLSNTFNQCYSCNI